MKTHQWKLEWIELENEGRLSRTYVAFGGELEYEVCEHASGEVTGLAFSTCNTRTRERGEIVLEQTFESRGTAMFTLEKLEG